MVRAWISVGDPCCPCSQSLLRSMPFLFCSSCHNRRSWPLLVSADVCCRKRSPLPLFVFFQPILFSFSSKMTRCSSCKGVHFAPSVVKMLLCSSLTFSVPVLKVISRIVLFFVKAACLIRDRCLMFECLCLWSSCFFSRAIHFGGRMVALTRLLSRPLEGDAAV